MTAEIAVLNRQAVALAADSKVSLIGGKAFDTADKIFRLSDVHPVGVMFCGGVEFLGCPLETLIGEYRKKKGRTDKPTVEAWGKDFHKFVTTYLKMDEDDIRASIAASIPVYCDMIDVKAKALQNEEMRQARLREDLEEPPEELRKKRPKKMPYETALDSAVTSLNRNLGDYPRFVSRAEADELLKDYSLEIAQAVESCFGDQSWNLRERIIAYCKSALARKFLSDGSSGLVIAGFGHKERYPSYVTYDFDGSIGKKHRIFKGKSVRIGHHPASHLSGFAQDAVVERFVQGVDPELEHTLRRVLEWRLEKIGPSISGEHGNDEKKSDLVVKRNIEKEAKETAAKMVRYVVDYGPARIRSRIESSVALLPKKELAHVAESLVAMTALDQLLSGESETVGGPVDVAVISKTDGFVWIKKKSYSPEMVG